MAIIKRIVLFSIIGLHSCVDVEPLEKISSLDEKESVLVGLWQYEQIFVNEERFIFFDEFMNPLSSKRSNRDELQRRKIRYYNNFTYQIEWVDRGDYELGEEGTPNYQPSFGTWKLNDNRDSLIHNVGTEFETWYSVNLVVNASKFSREHRRYISRGGAKWAEGSILKYNESFIKIE